MGTKITALEGFELGDVVQVTGVAFPDNPNHTVYIGQIGTIHRLRKGARMALVKFPNMHDRECSLDNIRNS